MYLVINSHTLKDVVPHVPGNMKNSCQADPKLTVPKSSPKPCAQVDLTQRSTLCGLKIHMLCLHVTSNTMSGPTVSEGHYMRLSHSDFFLRGRLFGGSLFGRAG